MTGSTRLHSTPASAARAPYSAPQAVAPSVTPTRNFDPETGAPLRLPVPFVPREFRARSRADVTILPAVERAEGPISSELTSVPNTTSITRRFNDDTAESGQQVEVAEALATEAPTAETPSVELLNAVSADAEFPAHESIPSAELPWIDAFAVDTPEPEANWPLGDAGKRLDELTQSLSSLDASRERQQAAELKNVEAAATAEPKLPMWNEEEWIDIMPTAPVTGESLHHESAPSLGNAESTARFLEGLAQRIRVGDVHVPASPTELGQEAMLAGLLASMLGWRQ